MQPRDPITETTLDLPADPMTLMMGPSHPATHGTVRIVVELSGETVLNADVQVGYLHRGFEKMCERGVWTQCFPYVDRCNYSSPMLNNVGFALAVEKLCQLSVPERGQYYRVVLGELGRIADHLICNAAVCMELGAFTPFLWLTRARDMIFDIFEEETGARVTHSFARVGGMAHCPTEFLNDAVRATLPKVLQAVDETLALVRDNRVFLDRTMGVGAISPSDAISLGWTGPCLRSTGIAYDVRKSMPYLVYDQLEFDVPTGTKGDNYDRFMVRCEEIRQCARIVEQAIAKMPDSGPVTADDPRYVMPSKPSVYSTIEGTIRHFEQVMRGIPVPAGEVYGYSEAANGELGFYLVSDGTGTPWRVRIRPPCFCIMSGLGNLVKGAMLADIIPTFGSLNMVGGECDR